MRAARLGALDQPFDQLLRAQGTFAGQHAVEGIEPLLRFERIGVEFRTRDHGGLVQARCARSPPADPAEAAFGAVQFQSGG